MGNGEDLRFLRSNVITEPLVDRFYAWLHTLAPVQAAMNLAFVQLPLLESYLQAPQVHISASANPALRGGYFVNIEEERSADVAALVESVRQDRAAMLEFAASPNQPHRAEVQKLLVHPRARLGDAAPPRLAFQVAGLT